MQGAGEGCRRVSKGLLLFESYHQKFGAEASLRWHVMEKVEYFGRIRSS